MGLRKCQRWGSRFEGIGGRPASVEEGAWGVVVVVVGCPGMERWAGLGSGCTSVAGAWSCWDLGIGPGGEGAQDAEVAVVSQWGWLSEVPSPVRTGDRCRGEEEGGGGAGRSVRGWGRVPADGGGKVLSPKLQPGWDKGATACRHVEENGC